MKVVINACYGGFGLSLKAIYELIKRNSKIIEKYTLDRWDDSKPIDKNRIKTRQGKIKVLEKYDEEYYILDKFTNVLYKDGIVYSYLRYSHRNDEVLVSIIEELGSSANGRASSLKVVEVPDDIEWEITEYDGWERIEEVHRTWG